jgi:hypothetical protein
VTLPSSTARRGPGEGYVAIDAAIGAIGDVDLVSVVGHAGQFDHCLLGYAQGTDGGTLSVGTRVPGAFIDVSDPVPFLLLLRTIAATARGDTGTRRRRRPLCIPGRAGP